LKCRIVEGLIQRGMHSRSLKAIESVVKGPVKSYPSCLCGWMYSLISTWTMGRTEVLVHHTIRSVSAEYKYSRSKNRNTSDGPPQENNGTRTRDFRMVTEGLHVRACIVRDQHWSGEQQSIVFTGLHGHGQSCRGKYGQCPCTDYWRCYICSSAVTKVTVFWNVTPWSLVDI
jgi:hypothetical protein